MRPLQLALLFASFLLPCGTTSVLAQGLSTDYARDPAQPIDQHYTDQMRKYTTDPAFTSPLVDYLPASTTVPTPAKVLGDVSGAPDMLPYAEDVYKYFRMLESSSPRVKVFTIGHSEEGREMIAAAIADPEFSRRQKKTAPASPSSETRAPSTSTTPKPANSSASPTPSTTSPEPSTRPKPERPPR